MKKTTVTSPQHYQKYKYYI